MILYGFMKSDDAALSQQPHAGIVAFFKARPDLLILNNCAIRYKMVPQMPMMMAMGAVIGRILFGNPKT